MVFALCTTWTAVDGCKILPRCVATKASPLPPAPPDSRQLLAGGLVKWVTFACNTFILETLTSDNFGDPGVHGDTQ